MKIRFEDDLELSSIADSGQCFRWKRLDNAGDSVSYRIIAGGRVLYITGNKDDRDGERLFELSCSPEDYEGFWRDYLDSGTSYSAIRAMIRREEDDYLYSAAESGKGIRILKQEPFETLISFIISQRKNIPAIMASVEKLCERAGERIFLSEDEQRWLEDAGLSSEKGSELFAFPGAEDIMKLSSDELSSCGTGYRTPYIRRAAEGVYRGDIDLKAMEALDDNGLFDELMKIYGVGKKVASCVCLFGFHRFDFFPVDVWIERILEAHYPEGFPFEKYAPFNGVMQQYMFFHGRGS